MVKRPNTPRKVNETQGLTTIQELFADLLGPQEADTTGFQTTAVTTSADMFLTVGHVETGEYGNKFNGASDADGVITAQFIGDGTDVILSLNAYDVDSNKEVEIYVNGVSIGAIPKGVNNGLTYFEVVIDASLLVDGLNEIEFVQTGKATFAWGVTDILVEAADIAMTLTEGVTETGEYGNKFNGTGDTDGVIRASFQGTGQDMVLTFSGYDVDSNSEVEVHLNGQVLEVLTAGVDNGLATYQILIPAGSQLAGTNVISFVQAANPNFAWGVTDITLDLYAPDQPVVLDFATTETGSYGEGFNGATDLDGRVTMTFDDPGQDVLLSFDAFDNDTPGEMEVWLNGTLLGVLPEDVDQSLIKHFFTIDAADLQAQNTIEFVQAIDPDLVWGVTNVLIEAAGPALHLSEGVTDTGQYGNRWNGLGDADGSITATFDGTGETIRISLDGYDIDSNTEVDIWLNGTVVGSLSAGSDLSMSSHEFYIAGNQQLVGTNTLTFTVGNPNWIWGITNITLETVTADPGAHLVQNVEETGIWGQNFLGTTEPDGRIDFTFDAGNGDLLFSFEAYDVDSDQEVAMYVNGIAYGPLSAGVNDDLMSYQIVIDAADVVAGTNTITFEQTGSLTYTWGVTNLTIEETGPVMHLAKDVVDTGTYGNRYNGKTDKDGEVQASFTSTGENLLLSFDGFDVDSATEVELFLNGVSLGTLPKGTDNGLRHYDFVITAEMQQPGENIISFQQTADPGFMWGVTNVVITDAPVEPVIALQTGRTEAGEFGNYYNGARDYDGKLDATFQNTGEDLMLSFAGWDIDTNVEIELFLNGVSLGMIEKGVSDDLAYYQYQLDAALMQPGTNTITWQVANSNWTWGVTDIRLDPLPDTFAPADDAYSQQWHLPQIGDIERIWADYTGAGINVGIYDDGLQHSHHDLDDNYDTSLNFLSSAGLQDPEAGLAAHGTAVAGIIGAENNGIGTVGVAFGADLNGVNIITGAADPTQADKTVYVEALQHMANFDVVNHSWVATSPGFDTSAENMEIFAISLPEFQNAVDFGRGGLGTVLVKAAGNDFANSSGDILNSSHTTIVVSATNSNGDSAIYSNHGADVLVAAPSNDLFASNLGIKTTDLLGADGYTDEDYTGSDGATGFGGTSAATPIVSGVVALMLEANPLLGWRDVQTILAYSADHTGTNLGEPVDPLNFLNAETDPWSFNGAGNWNGGALHYSADYGFGLVNVYDAVRMAEVWSLFGPAQTSANEQNVSVGSTSDISIATSHSITFDMSAEAMMVEAVEISLNLSDASVDVFLTSAAGTTVQLLDYTDAGPIALDWMFGAQAFRGEDLSGTWTLDIVNLDGGAVTLFDYSLDWFGAAESDDDVYHYTDEVFSAFIHDPNTGTNSAPADDAARLLLSDTGGEDWLNLSAMTRNLNIDLNAGATSTANSQAFITIAAGTVIENVVAGDGGDILTGNGADNQLHGMRGADLLFGGLGDDLLVGGEGADIFVFNLNDGSDVIEDFEIGIDLIELYGFGYQSYADLTFGTNGTGDAYLDFGNGDTLTFASLSTSDFQGDEFAFFDTVFV